MNKLKIFLCENFGCADKVNRALIFTYKKDNFRIQKCSIFKYELLKDGTLLFTGTYKQLIGYLTSFKEYYKYNEITLRNPETTILPKIANISILNDDKIKKLNNELSKSNIDNSQLKENVKNYKSEIQKLNECVKSKNEIIKSKNFEIEELRKDCQEAAELIELLYTKKEELNLGTKRYKLENFPKDVCDFIKDLIREYYNKK